MMSKDMKCLITWEWKTCCNLSIYNHAMFALNLPLKRAVTFNFFIVFEFLESIASHSDNFLLFTAYSTSIFSQKDMMKNFDAISKNRSQKCTCIDLTNQIPFSTFDIKSTTWNQVYRLVTHSKTLVISGFRNTVWSLKSNIR